MTHPAFELIRTQAIPNLNLEWQEYRHKKTGARHCHMASEDNNNVFLVTFLTVPQDSSGVAHVLEHTALCGSKHYDVRDPFFMMLRRSLNTFMNAFTSSDWTAYPFASQNPKDFYNLMSVYLDAAFFPSLNTLDFAQEGIRLEFEDEQDSSSNLVYKGVVYNEMKGAMSAPVRQLHQRLYENLFPTVTYHHNSGGDPAHIPELSHQALTDFHAKHYHPSNALFLTYGDLPVEKHHEMFESRALQEFEALEIDCSVPAEQRQQAAKEVITDYPLEAEELSGKTHLISGWLLGDITDRVGLLEAQLLSGVLLDNSASPLRKVLETCGIGAAPSPLCGLDDSMREMVFGCGVEGSDPERQQELTTLIDDTLKQIVEQGIDQQQVEAVLHQLELSMREVGGGGYPYGLSLMLQVMPVLLHGGDPLSVLDVDSALELLSKNIADARYIPQLVQKLLLDNPHRVNLVMKPDATLGQQQTDAETQQLATLRDTLDDAGKQQILDQTAALKQRQAEEDDPGLLPKVTLDDVPEFLNIPSAIEDNHAGWDVTRYDMGTNGLVYLQLMVELPQLPESLVDLLPYYCSYVTELGCGDDDYLTTQMRQASVCGSISSRVSVRSSINDVSKSAAYLVMSIKGLASHQQAMTQLLKQTFLNARFDELERIRELVSISRNGVEMQLVDSGHSYAMSAAKASFSPLASLQNRWYGFVGVQHIKTLDDSLSDDTALQQLANDLADIHQQVQCTQKRLLLISEQENAKSLQQTIAEQMPSEQFSAATAAAFFCPELKNVAQVQGWSNSGASVNYLAAAYPAVALGHADAAPLMVLGGFLRNGFLHTAIREVGGAYGAGAAYDADAAAFCYYTYRDPRLAQSLDDIEASIQWLITSEHQPRQLEEAILGVIGSMDRPSSPAGEASSAFYNQLHGRTRAQRQTLRGQILSVTLDDLQRVGRTYLKPEVRQVAVLSTRGNLDAAELENMDIQDV